jgi:hypothetical protein
MAINKITDIFKPGAFKGLNNSKDMHERLQVRIDHISVDFGKSPLLDLVNKLKSHEEAIMHMYGMPRQVVDLKRSISFDPSKYTISSNHVHDDQIASYQFRIQSMMTERIQKEWLDIMMKGTWDMPELDDHEEWKEEYIEGYHQNNIPL